MFDVHVRSDGRKYLKWVERFRNYGERGHWVDICHGDNPEAENLVKANRDLGFQVEIDEKGFYRALVLKD